MKQVSTKAKGNITLLQCIARLCQLGCEIAMPIGDSQKYDFIMDWHGRLYKIQSKHSRSIDGDSAFEFNTYWTSHNTRSAKRYCYSSEDIDFFATWFNNEVYLVPVAVCGSGTKTLRCAPSKNQQEKRVNFACDYEAPKILSKISANIHIGL